MASKAFSPVQHFKNAGFAYFFVLVNLARARRKYGAKLSEHFLPIQTIRDTCRRSSKAIKNITYWPRDTPYEPRYTNEWFIEPQLGSYKEGCRGKSNVKDMVYGEQYVHLDQYRSWLKGDQKITPGRVFSGIGLARAKELWDECLKALKSVLRPY